MRSACVAVILLLNSVSLFAHPGHGTGDGESAGHYITSPLHAGPVVAGLALVLIVGGWFSTVKIRKARARALKARKTEDR